MFDIICKALSFVCIILLGILFRRIGLLDEKMAIGIRNVLMYLTLPCSIITNFAVSSDIDITLGLIMVWGFVVDVGMMAIAYLYIGRKPSDKDSVYLFGIPSFNIGAFALPFVQNFLPGMGVVTACCFDAGNAIICTGGEYAWVTGRKSGKKGIDLKYCAKQLVSSPALIAYVGMFLFTILGGKLHPRIISFLSPIAQANTFVAMLMIGSLFQLKLKKEYLSHCARVLSIRFVIATLLAVFTYYMMPLPLIEKQALILLYFAPLSAIAPAYVAMVDGDSGMASCINSLSIIISLIMIPLLTVLLHIGL
ncbi:MAG: hypothetical protein PHP50_03250 [Lachnospiraceae bacterium]|nr:hypothetical protein [Lachnospiraceae bacterium]